MFSRKQNRLGATAVEFAVAAPVFLLTLLAIFEFGWMVVIRHTADNAAYEGVRDAIVPGGTAADAQNEANRIMDIVGARSIQVEVTPSNITPETNEVEVTVSGQYSDNGLLVTRFLRGAKFESTSRMLTERPRRQD